MLLSGETDGVSNEKGRQRKSCKKEERETDAGLDRGPRGHGTRTTCDPIKGAAGMCLVSRGAEEGHAAFCQKVLRKRTARESKPRVF